MFLHRVQCYLFRPIIRGMKHFSFIAVGVRLLMYILCRVLVLLHQRAIPNHSFLMTLGCLNDIQVFNITIDLIYYNFLLQIILFFIFFYIPLLLRKHFHYACKMPYQNYYFLFLFSYYTTMDLCFIGNLFDRPTQNRT